MGPWVGRGSLEMLRVRFSRSTPGTPLAASLFIPLPLPLHLPRSRYPSTVYDLCSVPIHTYALHIGIKYTHIPLLVVLCSVCQA